MFEYAIRQFKATANPGRALAQWTEIPAAEHRRPLTPKEIPGFIEAVGRYPGLPSTKNAVRLILLTFVRKSEASNAKWDEFDFVNSLWIIPTESALQNPATHSLARITAIFPRSESPRI